MKVKTPSDGMGGAGRFLVTVLIILIVLLVTVFFAVRTRGGHEFIEERIEKHLGVRITAERMRIGWPYALVLEDLRTEGFDEEGVMPGFAAREVRLGPSLRARYRLFIRRGHLRLVETEGEMWDPACFARLGELPYGDLADVTRMLPLTEGRVDLEVNGGRVEWFDRRKGILSSAHGIRYRVTPVRIPGRAMRHHALSLYSMTRPNGARMSDVAREWLSSDTIENVELMDAQLEGTVAP
ncbi:MAG: hypothetical protein QGH42_01620 [Kiritimatiellia bacterium]|nr:hypothetical protein [Kiritimatiellia bacterium]MDP6629489.1 hypothetical protein [Kiritimatiellia bacterium]MDP6809196.1 hypothetical protein [Kiritimatiellia bacterium]MDP7022935.1 hypothetical protein [Kiritimatiellia bacterium]